MGKKSESGRYKAETKVTLINFLSEASNFIWVIATAIATMSLSIFMDVINSTCNLLRTGFCTLLSVKLQKSRHYKYNYGTDNLETVSMLFCEVLLLIGTVAVMAFAVVKLFKPSAPGNLMLVAVIYKAICVAYGLFLVYACWSVYRKTGTKVAKSNFATTFSSAGFDIAVFMSVLMAFLFKGYRFVSYVEPVASILIGIYVIIKAISRIREYLKELTFVTLEEADQIKIDRVLASHFQQYEGYFSVRSHKIGKTVCIDFLLSFPRDITYQEIITVLDSMTKELEEAFESCKVSLIFDNNTCAHLK